MLVLLAVAQEIIVSITTCYTQALARGCATATACSEACARWQGAQALHLEPLYHHGDLQPLSEPFRLFNFDLARPPAGNQQVRSSQVLRTWGEAIVDVLRLLHWTISQHIGLEPACFDPTLFSA